MPKPLQYRSGSVIYFQGDPADKIFILQNGKVSLGYQDIESGGEIRDSVQPGEFFGVKSALGKYPREENAMALSDTTVMAFTVPEFENVAMANSRIIMKMLKVFSNQMRRVHKHVSRLMAKEEEPPEDSLFNVGEFYLKNKRFSHAIHVFGRYLTFHPSGKHAVQASKNLEIAENALASYGDGKGPGMAINSIEAPVKQKASLSPEDSAKAEKAYHEAANLIGQGKFQEAFLSFKTIADTCADPAWTAKSSYQVGRCMFLLNKYEDSLKYLTNLLTSYPKHPDLSEIMFIMGQCNEKSGRKDQAAAFYKKILSMGTGSEGTLEKVKRALNLLTSGAQGGA